MRSRNRKRRIGAALIGASLLASAAIELAASRPYYSAKYAPALTSRAPRSSPRELQPSPQHSGHTCGYRALQSIYRAYGLDPEEADLRFRLGVDQPALPGCDDTLGTLHPDALRVLAQDGFEVELVALEHPGARARLERHVAEHTALALIVLRPSGGLHWVVLERVDAGRARIVDSLASEPYERDLRELFDESLGSLLLVTPGARRVEVDVSALHAEGLREMVRVSARVGAFGG